VNKDTGQFVKIGNIFSDGKTENTSGLTKTTGSVDDTHIIVSLAALQVGFSAGPTTYAYPFFIIFESQSQFTSAVTSPV
jgi:hypothetical protein